MGRHSPPLFLGFRSEAMMSAIEQTSQPCGSMSAFGGKADRRAHPSFRASCRSAVGWFGMQCVRSRREPVATSPSIGTAAFAWKSGWSFMDRLPRRARSSIPQRPLAPWHGQRISGLIAAWALRTTQFASGVEPTIANLRVQIGRCTATGKANGIPIHRRSEPMSTIC